MQIWMDFMKNILLILINKLKNKIIYIKNNFINKFNNINKKDMYNILFQIFLRVISLLFVSIIIYIYCQFFCNGKFIFEKERMKLNFLLIYIIIGVFYCLTGKLKTALIISMIITFIVGIINHFITAFRGTPLVPWDIFSLNVALSVMPTFKFTLTKEAFLGIVFFAFGLFLITQIKYQNFNIKKTNILFRLFLLAFIVNFFTSFYFTDMISKYNLDENWDPKEEYHNNGLVASIFKQSKNLIITKPDNYNFEYIYELAQTIEIPIKDNGTANEEENNNVNIENTEYNNEAGRNYNENNSEKNDIDKNIDNNAEINAVPEKPNIIAIMNESFADLRVIGNFPTNSEYLPFYNSIKENAIKGNLHMSVFGATTPNSEWEFLTSNSMAFVPKRTVPYQQYVLRNSYSLATILKSQGYSTTAIHCYYPQGYNRNLAYPRLGFEKFLSIFTLDNLEYIREYPNDLSTYKNIINLYENKKDDEKMFNFTLTMQNHGSYTDENFQNSVVAFGGEYPKLNQYLSLIKITDSALEYLINYFKNQEEHTIIVLFGDHQPYVEDEFYNYLLEANYGTTEAKEAVEKKYITPFIIWANYDIDENEYQNIKEISANYLASLVLDVADLKKTPYLQFLDELREEIPIITGNGYMDKTGIYHDFSEDTEYSELLDKYRSIQYNNMFDNANRLSSLFEVVQY